MAIYLLDSSVIIDALNNKRDRRKLLFGLASQSHVLACCTINLIEVYAGMRPEESKRTNEFLYDLTYFEITIGVAQRAGALKTQWARRGQTLSLADVTIAAVALEHDLTLMTDNGRHFPMPELQKFPFPA